MTKEKQYDKNIEILTVKEFKDGIRKSDSHSVKEHNTVFRQMESSLILVAGIFLALSGQFSKEINNTTITVKILTLIIIIFLGLSILLGILQLFLEANYFKKIAVGKREISKNIDTNNPDSVQQYVGASRQFSVMIGNSVTRWPLPTYIEMFLLGVAVILISVVSGIQLLS